MVKKDKGCIGAAFIFFDAVAVLFDKPHITDVVV